MTVQKFSPIFIILSALLSWTLAEQVARAFSWGHDSFQLTEWLINYSGGFVRRGLLGEMVWEMVRLTGVQANHLVIGLSVVFYLVLTIWFLRHSDSRFPPILILSCIVMGFPAYQDSVIRKDCLGLLLLLVCLKMERSGVSRGLVVFGVNLAAIVAILIHEAFAFYGLAALVILGRSHEVGAFWAGVVKRGVALLPAGLCFLATAVFHGTPEAAEMVNDSWLALWQVTNPGDAGNYSAAAAIQALGWDAQHGLSLSINLLTSGFYQPLAWVVVFAISFTLFLLFTGRGEAGRRETILRVAGILVLQLVFISPLFLLGYDYGRWLFLWMASSMMLAIMGCRAPTALERMLDVMASKCEARFLFNRIPAKEWYFLFFGVPVVWNKFEFISAIPICRLALYVWKWF